MHAVERKVSDLREQNAERERERLNVQTDRTKQEHRAKTAKELDENKKCTHARTNPPDDTSSPSPDQQPLHQNPTYNASHSPQHHQLANSSPLHSNPAA